MLTNNYYLIVDIGGTNANFAIYNKDNNLITKIYNFKTSELLNFNEFLNLLLTRIVDEEKILIQNTLFAVAGKINNRKKEVTLTNRNITINTKEILNLTTIRKLKLINDFTAIASSIPIIKKSNIKILNKGKEKKVNKVLLIGAGTGIGVSYINKDKIKESEDGHLELTKENNFDKKLINFLKKKSSKNTIEFEEVLSGRGLENIYYYLNSKNKTNNLTAKEISISKKTNKISEETFEIFYNYYARFMRLLSNKFKPDQIYLAGGIIEKNMVFSKEDFIKEFSKDNEKFKEIPIKIIKNYSSSIDGLVNYIKTNNL